jgi:hypothetical protein
MNTSPKHRPAMAAFTLLTCALSVMLAGCTSKTTAVPPAQAPPAAAAPGAAQNVQAAPAPEPALVLPRGTRLEVRLNQTIDVKHAYAGEMFNGSLVESVMAGNSVAVPAGSNATGEILVAHRRGLFKGKSVMALKLTRLEVNGAQYRIDSSTLSESKKGKGRRSAALIGGGAGMGMLIGGVATGGVGLLVGGLAGGGAGALGAAFTGNRDLSIPAETVVNFRLQNELTLTPDTQGTVAEVH